MSWDGYITNLQAPDTNGSVTIEEAAIWGQNPLSPWASSKGLSGIKAEELKGLLGDRKCLQQGIEIAGMKCVFLREVDTGEDITFFFKTKKESEQEPSYCIIIGKTKTAFVITKGCATAQGGDVSKKTGRMVEYLCKSGY